MITKKIKCVVWDLDNTIWDGVLIEDKQVRLKDNIVHIIKTLDDRGILQSICSKNDFDPVVNKLKEFMIHEYFIYPEISWNPKSHGINNIAKLINIGIDSIAFIDDQEFERDEVAFHLKDALCLDSAYVDRILEMDEFMPDVITDDTKNRRALYQSDIKRKEVEENYIGPKEEFYNSLGMILTIKNVEKDDLKRVQELTLRTNQLNSTGITYSYAELEKLIRSNKHDLIIAQLDDKYGTYGKIGLALIEKTYEFWTLKLMLMSCRVASRGVGSVFLNYIAQRSKDANMKLIAELIPTDRNRIMYITYKFSGFSEIYNDHQKIIFEADFSKLSPMPSYIKVFENEIAEGVN